MSPTLFNLYMLPLTKIVHSFGLSLVSCADDTQSFQFLLTSVPVTFFWPIAAKQYSWMAGYKLKLNENKTEVRLLGNSFASNIQSPLPDILSKLPAPKKAIKSIGIWLDIILMIGHQAKKLAAPCYGILRLLRKILNLFRFIDRRVIVQALMLSHLNYGNALYLGSPRCVIRKLQTVQNAAAQLLMKIPKHQSAKTALRDLHWLPVERPVHFKIL